MKGKILIDDKNMFVSYPSRLSNCKIPSDNQRKILVIYVLHPHHNFIIIGFMKIIVTNKHRLEISCIKQLYVLCT